MAVAAFLLAASGALLSAAYLKSVIVRERERLTAELNAVLSHEAISPGWRFPSKLFSAAFPLEQGVEGDLKLLEGELTARGYRKTWCDSVSLPGAYCIEKTTPSRAVGGNGQPARRVQETLLTINLRGWNLPFGKSRGGLVSVAVADNQLAGVKGTDGETAGFSLEPLEFAWLVNPESDVRTFIRAAEVSPPLVKLLVAAEDRRYFEHFGVDLTALARAAWHNLLHGGYQQGASTLTQQVVRSFFLPRRKTLSRKLKEMLWAVLLEQLKTKDEILELYWNSIYLGQHGGHHVCGFAEAARFYFGKPAAGLSLAESALLVALIPAPNTYNPFRNWVAADQKRKLLVDQLARDGLLTSQEAEAAKAKIVLRQQPYEIPNRFRHYAEYVRYVLQEQLDLKPVDVLGLQVLTALDPYLTARAQQALDEGIEEIERYTWKSKEDPLQGAVFAVDVNTGLVPVVLGGRSSEPGEFNRAFMMYRQPGSAFKPVAYAAAFEQRNEAGAWKYWPVSLVPDLPRAFPSEEGPWRPRNNDWVFHPQVTLLKGLAKSINVATSNLVEQVTAQKVAELSVKLGLPKPAKIVPSIGLGTTETNLPRLVAAFLPFIWHGEYGDTSPIAVAYDDQDRERYRFVRGHRQVLAERTTDLMMEMLQGVVNGGTAWGLRGMWGFHRPVAGKTGTTQRERDAWFIGLTPQMAMGIWIGKDQGGQLFMPANDIAVPIWARVAEALLEGRPYLPFAVPRGYAPTVICPWTGLLANATCTGQRVNLPKEVIPRGVCQEEHPPPEELILPYERWWEKKARLELEAQLEKEAAEQDQAAAAPPEGQPAGQPLSGSGTASPPSSNQ